MEELFKEHYNALLAFCTAMAWDVGEAEDLAQETLLRAIQNAGLLEELGRSQRRAWLKKTARNLFIDGCRRRSRETEEAPEDGRWDDHSEWELMDACQRLPEAERELFILRYIEGYSSTELGEMYGLPPSTVRARLMSARRKMKKYYFEGE